MKKRNLLYFVFVCILVLFSACNNTKTNSNEKGGDNTTMSLEKIAENSLSDKEKMEIIKNEKPIIGEQIVTKKQAHLIGEQYDGKSVTSVTFVTNNQVLGNITVYLYDGKVIGKGLRD